MQFQKITCIPVMCEFWTIQNIYLLLFVGFSFRLDAFIWREFFQDFNMKIYTKHSLILTYSVDMSFSALNGMQEDRSLSYSLERSLSVKNDVIKSSVIGYYFFSWPAVLLESIHGTKAENKKMSVICILQILINVSVFLPVYSHWIFMTKEYWIPIGCSVTVMTLLYPLKRMFWV